MIQDVNANLINKQSVETYTTQKFSNEGVAGSTPVTRMNENYQAITPLPMESTGAVEFVAHNTVKIVPVGVGSDDLAPLDNKGIQKSGGASASGNHS